MSAPGGDLQVGVVAERLGLSVRTLHHWEEKGLVTPSYRSSGGFRLYTEDDVERLLLIRRMKPLEIQPGGDAAAAGRLRRPGRGPQRDATRWRSSSTADERTEEGRADLVRKLTWADEFVGASLTERFRAAAHSPEVATPPVTGP